MKKSILALLIVLFCFAACTDDENNKEINCSEDSLHMVETAKGMMIYLPCYDSWAVQLDEYTIDGEERTIAASYEIDDTFQEDSLRVELDACLIEFNMTLILPDPALWGSMYEMEDFNLRKE